MSRRFPSPLSITLASALLVPLASCANSSLGNSLQKSLEADPQLTATAPNPTSVVPAQPGPTPGLTPAPSDFPPEIPLYPNSRLQQVTPPTLQGRSTTWSNRDSSDRILNFYRQELANRDWKLLSQPEPNISQGSITAQRENLRLTVTVPAGSPAPNTNTDTTFNLSYDRQGQATGTSTPSPTPTSGSSLAQLPAFTDSTTLGATGSSSDPRPSGTTTTSLSDLDKAPKQLQPYLRDLTQLGILAPSGGTKETGSQTTAQFNPQKIISRREYVRWLVETNNRLFANRPAQQIRLASDTSQPAFQDVPRTDPDFEAIQGLAEAGILPSSLSGDSTIVNFRPDAPLTRESLLLWKVPIDTRQPLPTATIDGVKQTWGFQDAARIEPRALRAVLADYQNGDLSNIRRAFGYTTLFQPKKQVTRAEAAAALWYIGFQGEGQSAQDLLKTEPLTP